MWDKIKGFFGSFFKNPMVIKFEQFVEQVFVAEKPVIMGALKDVAVQAVMSVDSISTLTNAEKRAQAFAQIAAHAKQEGIQVGESMINLAIEMALQAVKGNS